MIVGVPKEIKPDENRVSMTPVNVEVMVHHGHKVLIESGAGAASGFSDDDYAATGAEIVPSPAEIFDRAEMVLRVKEPQPAEFLLLHPDRIYFSYLHLAASPDVAKALVKAGSVNIAYETIQKKDGSLPLLKPMSEVAGPMAVQEGAKYLEMAQGGHGILLGGVPGVDPGTVLIIGGGVVGLNAAKKAAGLGAKVYVLDTDLDRLRYLSDVMPSNCFVLMSTPLAIRELLPRADLVIGSVLIPGSRAPHVITRDMLILMKKGAVLVDVAIDQGGCFETSRETTHLKPTFTEQGIVHYCVSNMPGALPKTSTMALTNATMLYALELADKGWQKAMKANEEIRKGANVVKGKVTHAGVAAALGMEYSAIEGMLG